MHQARRCASDGARKAADRASSDALLAAQARRRTEEVEARAAAAQAAQRMAAVETSKHTSDGAALAGAARVLPNSEKQELQDMLAEARVKVCL